MKYIDELRSASPAGADSGPVAWQVVDKYNDVLGTWHKREGADDDLREWNMNAYSAKPLTIRPLYSHPAQSAPGPERERLMLEAMVELAIPYEALLRDGGSRKWIAPSIWEQIEKSVALARPIVIEAAERLRVSPPSAGTGPEEPK